MTVRRLGFLALVALLVVSACSGDDVTETPSTTVPPSSAASATTTTADVLLDTSRVPADLTELDAALAAIAAVPSAGAAEDAAAALYETLAEAERVPFVDGGDAVFLYYGEGDEIAVLADFNGFGRLEPLRLGGVGDTSLWWARIALPSDARSEYRLDVDGEQIVDPANERTKMAGDAINSVLTMPDYKVTDFTHPAGGLTGTLEDVDLLTSEAMGYDIAYQVYLPSGYEDLQDLAVLYVTDGSDFSNPQMGAMTIVLDNLIGAGTIKPVMAVFIDAWDPDRVINRREIEFLERPEDYTRFVTTELVPIIDATYATDPRPESRVIVGTSFGAVGAIYVSVLSQETFNNLSLFSLALPAMLPDYHSDPNRADTAVRMMEVVDASSDCTDGECPAAGVRIFMSAGIPEWDVGDLSPVYQSWDEVGIDYQILNVSDGHNWGHWAGVTDEMLEFFFTTD
jgi:enterochelin esterase-like enzyme